jgi:hypothetical protein
VQKIEVYILMSSSTVTMPYRYQIGDRVLVKNDKTVYTITGFVSTYDAYMASWVGTYEGRSVLMENVYIPDALIVSRV